MRMALTASGPQLRGRFEAAVAERGLEQLEGALLVSRHGVPLAGSCPGVKDVDAFAAMHATALGAAEVAFSDDGGHAVLSLVAEMDGRRFVSHSLRGSMFVVAVVRPGADCTDILAWMGGLADELS